MSGPIENDSASHANEFLDEPVPNPNHHRSDSNESTSSANDASDKTSGSGDGSDMVKKDMEFFLARLQRSSSVSSH